MCVCCCVSFLCGVKPLSLSIAVSVFPAVCNYFMVLRHCAYTTCSIELDVRSNDVVTK